MSDGKPGAAVRRVTPELPAWIAAGLFLSIWPGALVIVFLSAGIEDLPLLAALWSLLLFLLLPAVEGAAAAARRTV